MKLTPILLFAYRRFPEKTIENLLKNPLAVKSNIYIYSDGYKNELDKEDVLEVRKYLQTINGFNNINIIESNKNNGLANSIIDGVSEIIQKYDKVIVLEDDLIVSEDFLDYMNNALSFYKEDENIWSISGYAPKLPCFKTLNLGLYLSSRASSWGWATWKDRWDEIDWDIKDWDEFKKDKIAKEKFNLGGNDMFKMLELQMLGKIDSWAIRWCYNQFKLDKYTVYPKESKVINDGFLDSKGTHNSGVNNKLTLELSNKKIEFKKLHVDYNMLKCFKEFHNLSIKTKIGYFLKKYGNYEIVKRLYKYMQKESE